MLTPPTFPRFTVDLLELVLLIAFGVIVVEMLGALISP